MEELYVAIALSRKGSGLISTPCSKFGSTGGVSKSPGP